MSRWRSALAAMMCSAALVAACQSGGATAAPAAQSTASSGAGPALPSGTPAAETQAPQTATPRITPPAGPSPSPVESASSAPEAAASPSPSSAPDVTYSPAPQPSLALQVSGAPATPAGTRLDLLPDPCNTVNPNEACSAFRVEWQESNPAGVTIRVYAVTTCLHSPTRSKPSVQCLLDGDKIPRSALVLLGSAPASDGTFSFVLGEGETAAFGWLPGDGPDVDAVVLQAVDAHGGSPFAIAGSSGSCLGCVL